MDLLSNTIERIKTFQPSEGYYGAFSGGKDSQVLYHVAQMAGVKVDWHFHLTTVDPPQLLRFIRQYYPDVIWDRPKLTMFQLILKHKILPTRLIRYCCSELKEVGGHGRSVLIGVRAEESRKRSKYSMVRICQRSHQYLIRPLLDWKWGDVWSFLSAQNIPHCELYDPPYNFKRIGCVGCPMAGKKVWNEFRHFPKFKNAYVCTIRKLMASGVFSDFENAEDVLTWWINGNRRSKNKQTVFCFD